MATGSAVNIKPLADRVVVKPLDESEESYCDFRDTWIWEPR